MNYIGDESGGHNTHQSDYDRIFGDDSNIVVFVRDNEDDVLELIELWETSNGREFDENNYNQWFNNHMLYEGEGEEENED